MALLSRLSWPRILVHTASYIAILAAVVVFGLALYRVGNPEDLRSYFLPAARAMTAGESPYSVPGFYGPPWALFPVVAVAWLPDQLAYAVFGVLSMAALVVFLVDREVGAWHQVPTLLFMPVVVTVLMGNLEPFILLALIVPRPWGMLLLAMKPQVGAVLGLLWVIDEARTGGLGALFRLLWPVTVLTGLSFVLYGFWPAIWLDASQEVVWWNLWAWVDLPSWVHMLILGVPVAIYALVRKDEDVALGASTLLSPYTTLCHLCVWAPGVSRLRLWLAWTVCLLSWIPAGLRLL